MKTVVIERKKYVLVPYKEYRKLTHGVPSLPAADLDGSRPALAFADAAIARCIVRDRQKVGLSQKELAELAGIRVEVLNRAERGVVVPSVRTLQKIENALKRSGLRR
jgi:DNA-binding XRE family transcriptional regulator